ncbi:FAD-dependent oxidoreductase [Candidatus Uhrbacteria bacterium]|nr:FAD-dependent oxidoreductase [Candidatus Uhrbacteria bacterium]
MYDVLLVGGGPAGMAAAIYLARQKLKIAMFTGSLGGQVIWSSDIENYLGLHQLTGVQLVQRFQKHLEQYKQVIEIHEDEKATSVDRVPGGFRVTTPKGSYEGKALLIASGAMHRKLNVPGEKELAGNGVTYCATCDAPLYKDKTVYVIGGGNSAMDAALFAAKYSKEVHLLTINEELTGDITLKKSCLSHAIVKVHTKTKTVRFEGKGKLERIVYEEGGEERAMPADAAFIEIGLTPTSGFIDFVKKNQWQEIIVDKHNATDVEGVFAAGDVTDVTEKQIAVAVGEGSKAALSVIKYLMTTA